MDTPYPSASKAALADRYVGRSIRELPTPAAVLDLAPLRRNCDRMLRACDELDLQWRCHVKTHKTAEITRLQVGDNADRPARIVVSTLEEAEFLADLMEEYRGRGREVNILYGIPVPPSKVSRLYALGRRLGPNSISVLIDHPDQVGPLRAAPQDRPAVVPHVYVKVNMGGDRAGVVAGSGDMSAVLDAALAAHDEGAVVLRGLYSHAGHSYGGDSRVAALRMLGAEIDALARGAAAVAARRAARPGRELPPLVLSVGASPTALSVQNMCSAEAVPEELRQAAAEAAALIARTRAEGRVLEIHAGVYPLLDLQQLAAHSVASSRLSWADMAFTVLAEVHSFYPGRGEAGKPEALVGAGGLALGREYCKAYKGFAMLSPWNRPGVRPPAGDVEEFQGWMIGRFAQEHGIATCMGAQEPDELKVGQLVRLWPNHACITSSHFGYYAVVDSASQDAEQVVDIFIRTRGW